MPTPKKQLDHVVKFGLGVMITSFALIFGGMFLMRPDRSIPAYSIGSQEGTIVAVHVPSWTSDDGIEALIRRFRHVGRTTRDFGGMKIQPTTPGHRAGNYQRITIYTLADASWATPDVLSRYVKGDDEELNASFRKAVRGTYRLQDTWEEGRIGPIVETESPATAAYSRLLFAGHLDQPAREVANSESRPAAEAVGGSAATAPPP